MIVYFILFENCNNYLEIKNIFNYIHVTNFLQDFMMGLIQLVKK